MNSERRIAASRANGAKSKGPKTPEGKRISSQNAVRSPQHPRSLLTKTILIDGESAQRFTGLLDALKAELQPATPLELALVESIAVCRWRQLRIWGVETAGLSHEIEQQKPSTTSHNHTTRAALAVRNLTDRSHLLDFTSRYEARNERQYARTLRRLLDLQTAHKNKNRAGEPTLEGLDLSQTPEPQ